MLRISKLADYGTLVMVHLARHPHQRANAKDIAAAIHLAVPTVSKLLKLLTSAQLLESQRGVKGGYLLREDPKAISVARIISAIDGELGLTECSYNPGECSLEAICHIRSNWQTISQAVNSALAKVSLLQLSQPRLTTHKVPIETVSTRQQPRPRQLRSKGVNNG